VAQVRRRRRAAGDLSQLKVELWACIRHLADTIENEELSQELRLRACSAMGQVGGVYRALIQASELESRISALEEVSRGKP
jgi:hypothetical protein